MGIRKLWAIVGAVVGAIAGYLFATVEKPIAIVSVIIVAVAAYALAKMYELRAVRKGVVLYDERDIRISEKALSQAFRLSIIVVSLAIAVTMWPSYFGVDIVPHDIAVKLFPGLGLSLAIMVVTLFVSLVYYSMSRRPIEG